ncbi:MAG: hypothetical protein ACI8P9_000350 [Parasphingorhabdus sp.]|jgi:hypothetical protein
MSKMSIEATTSPIHKQVNRPWYREPMVWMIIAIPLTSVVVGIGMLTMSIKSYDGLVVDDYYKRGKEINRVLERAQMSVKNQISANIDLSLKDKVIVSLLHRAELEAPDQVRFNLRHRTRAGLDLTAVLIRYADGYYRGDIVVPNNGLWLAQIETSDWLVEGQLSLPEASSIILGYK